MTSSPPLRQAPSFVQKIFNVVQNLFAEALSVSSVTFLFSQKTQSDAGTNLRVIKQINGAIIFLDSDALQKHFLKGEMCALVRAMNGGLQ